jgi:hypothetical protein
LTIARSFPGQIFVHGKHDAPGHIGCRTLSH